MRRLDGIICVRVGGTQSLRSESASQNPGFACHQSIKRAAWQEECSIVQVTDGKVENSGV